MNLDHLSVLIFKITNFPLIIVLFFFNLGLNRELAKVTRRADQVDQLEEQINTLQNQYTATEQKYQTMLTVCYIFKIF